MMARYEQLKKANLTSSPTFNDYLISMGFINSGLENALVIVSTPVQQSLPTDNSVDLDCDYVAEGSYFHKGNTYAIGSNGKRKAKYYTECYQLMANTVSMDGSLEWTRLYGCAGYYETFFFGSFERASLRRFISNPLLVFKLS